jgi:hypothetical protein
VGKARSRTLHTIVGEPEMVTIALCPCTADARTAEHRPLIRTIASVFQARAE